ncbi:MAG: aldehyde dehydrogenase family protein, partial [Phycisphaeraceae bacterium]|nr:aldehyde dehydrogenase family protein [Phycisphaeraceae bacterium]
HPAHPGTCELLAGAVKTAIEKVGAPAGAFSLVHGASHEVGLALVRHPLTQAVAFTGSLRGGRALFDAAAARENPIPVYAEMGSTNPVFLLPGALAERAGDIATGYVQSVTLGVGQFCTNPGVVLGLDGEGLDSFAKAAASAAAEAPPSTMLHNGILDAYNKGVERLGGLGGVEPLGRSSQQADPEKTEAACVIHRTDIQTFESTPQITEEVFGPTSVVVQCQKPDDLMRVAENLDGHLTATIHGTEQDLADHADLVAVLENKVGRLIFNGFPTGIEVCHAMHHGGPYPATTDGHYTSIGTGSIHRFARPVCYQNFPDASLPEPLQEANPRKIWRLVDGDWSDQTGS